MSIEVNTLQGYLDDNKVDLIDTAISSDYVYKAKVSAQIWAMYRYAIINGCDIARWTQRATDKATNLHNRYSTLFAAYDALQDAGDLTALDSTETETETRDLATTSGSTETTAATGSTSDTRTTATDTDVTSSNTATGEDLPATSGSSASSWLNSRDISNGSQTQDTTVTETGSGSTKDDTTRTASGTGTDKGTITRARNSQSGMIPAELYRRMKDALYDPYYEYAREWYDLFVPLYADICGCCR